MKKMLMTMLCLLMALGMGAKNDDVQLKVIVKGYEGGYVMLAHGHDYDTLRADKKGRFDLHRHMERPAQLMLVVDQLRTHRPEQGFTNGSWYMEGLKRNFTSQQMINALASDFVGSYIQRAPKDLSETWEAYCKTCIDKGQIAKLQAKYDKFNPGKDAPDFETTGYEDGKTYTLKDFRGKALMIDCWATWCGPCMAEMPYYAKVV